MSERKFYAHSVSGKAAGNPMTEKYHIPDSPGSDGVFWARPGERLEEHLTKVSSSTGCRSGNRLYGEIAGLLHDIGKYSPAFQAYLRANSGQADEEDENTPGRPDHSSAGGQLMLDLLRKKAEQTRDAELGRLVELIGRIIAHPVAGHHAGLLDSIDTGGGASLDRRLRKVVEPYDCNLAREIRQRIEWLAGTILEDQNLDYVCRWIDSDGAISGREAFSLQFAIRMLFSALVDADRLDSERAGNLVQWRIRTSIRTSSLPALLDKLEEHLTTLPSGGTVNKIRRRVSEQCRDAAADEPGFFSLTVPTGGGKTFASLRFALHHAKYGMRRVIYVMPYTTIIDQNADEFRKILDPDGKTFNVLEHHSNLEPRRETPESRLLSENWDNPIVVTTTVQFYESLYVAKPSRCRRLHSIRQSVIILDEAQTVPVRYLKAVTWALEELVTNYGCSVVFCTATQPLLDCEHLDAGALDNHRVGISGIRPIISEPQRYFDALCRVQVQGIKSQSPLPTAEIASRVRQQAMKNKSVLCILNTKQSAKAVFTELEKGSILDTRLWYLSTAMCPQHRKDVIEIVKLLASYCRKTGTKAPVVVSTQLVEAGVNLDFDVVFRAMAGIDSLAQAAGRCNREGRLPHIGEVYFFTAEENLGSLQEIIEAKRAGIDTLSVLDGDATLTQSEKYPIGLKAVEEYFQRLYWSRASEMDSKRIIARLVSPRKLEEGADVPFATIANDFQLIEKDTVSIVVPYGYEGKRLIGRLLKGGVMGLDDYRIANRYSVQVFRNALPRLSSIVVESAGGWLVLGNDRCYGETGLLGPDELSVEDYMV